MGIQINGNTNNINAGIGSLSIEDLNELDIVGVATASNFKTGSSNLHSTGLTVGNALVHSTGVNVGTGATIHSPATNVLTFGTNSNERFRIKEDGKIEVPTTGKLSLGMNNPVAQFTAGTANGSRVIEIQGTDGVIRGYDRNSSSWGQIDFEASAYTFDCGGSEKLRISSSGYVNIGSAAAPRKRLDITGPDGRSGASPGNSDTALIIDNDGGNGAILEFLSDNNAYGRIFFTDTDASNQGQIVYEHGNDAFQFTTGGTERLRITSVGDVGIGTAIPVVANGYGNLSLAGNTGGQLELKQVSSDIRHYIWGNQNLNIGGGYTNGSTSNIRFLCNGATERLKITSTGILVTGNGTAPNSTDVGSIFMPGGGDLGWLTSSGSITFNAYYNGGWKYVTSGTSHILWASSEGFNFSTASSGSADGTISYSRAMKIFTNNRVSIGDGNSGTPLAALHINTKSTMGTDTALWIGDNSAQRYLVINQTSGSEQFSELKLRFNDNGTPSLLKLQNPYGPAGYGTAILWQGYNDGQQGMILCQSEGANSAAATMYLNSSSGTFLQGNSSRHVTMPQQPSFSASRSGGAVYNGSTIIFNAVDFNNGSHYNNTNGTFTAPTAGKYQFSVAGMAAGGNADFQVRIQKNGSNYFNNNGSGRGSSTFEPYGFTVLMDLAANDTVKCTIYSSNASSYFYGSGTTWNKFSGSLIA